MHNFENKLIMFIIMVLWTSMGLTQTIGLQGQLSGWMSVNTDRSNETQLGIRYIPALSINKTLSKNHSLDAEISLNSYGTDLIRAINDMDTNGKIKPYRMWLRFSSSQFEIRAGLQKINFGSASILRPLMWFDRIDSRDPLQLTDGVYSLLGRYYFLNNANIWLWGLYGNEDTKGWEMIPSKENTIEYGGRVQIPFFTGEMALTYHQRKTDPGKGLAGSIPLNIGPIPEKRYGFDTKLDVGVGIWFEGVLVHRDIDIPLVKYQRLTNVGMDYTFDFGNGLNALTEYLILETSDKAFGSGEGISFSALSLNYPLNLLDTVTGMIYYDWDNKNWYRIINVQRTLDQWSFYLLGFWNPDEFQIYQNTTDTNLFAGKGFQIMVVFNH